MSGLHLVEAFLEMMSAERGAARNTIEAYRRDLSDYAGFLAGKGKSPQTAEREEVVAYLGFLDAQGLAASSAARRLSALRQFHKFLCADQIRPDDPTRIVASPRARRPLPHVLSVAEVDTAADDGREPKPMPMCRRRRKRRRSGSMCCSNCSMPPACASRSW